MICGFDIGAGWANVHCEEEVSRAGQLCSKHATMKCSCGKQAVALCCSASSLVCGAPCCEVHAPYCPRHI